jgi:hypothetical protein
MSDATDDAQDPSVVQPIAERVACKSKAFLLK